MKEFGIIFDCDGTLVDSLGKAFSSFNYALEKIGEGPHSMEAVKRFFGAGADRIFMGVLQDERRAREAFEHYLSHQTSLAKSTRLHDGIRELLDVLEEEGVPLGVVTGRHARDLEIVLDPHELSDCFQALVADSHLPKSKPAPDGIRMAAEKMGLDPARTLYVGDSVMDMQAARAAGSVGVAALWDPMAKREEMAKAHPEFLAETPTDVWTIFKKRFRF